MALKPDSSLEARSDLKQTFLRYLPERVEAIEEGWLDFASKSWNVAKVPPLVQRVQDLAGFANKFGFVSVRACLLPLVQCLLALLELRQAPSTHQLDQIATLFHHLKLVSQEDVQIVEDSLLSAAEQPQVWYLGGDKDLASKLSGALGKLHYSLSYFTQATELLVKFAHQPPAALLVDASLLAQIAEMAYTTTALETPLKLVVLADSRSLETRLQALRAGALAFFSTPIAPQLVAERIHRLLMPLPEPQYRVVVMDDDPSQADFAAAILRKGSYEVRAVTNPTLLLDVIEEFRPDLLLMDLYMPGVDGLELTRIIREQTPFTALPIVFMSGEQDTDKHLDALASGGDDFLTKPIRPPRRMLSIVKSRILRARALQPQAVVTSERDPATGLFNRPHLFTHLNMTLANGSRDLLHGLICLELDSWESIYATTGPRQYEALISALGARFITQLMPQDLCARIDKNRFGVLAARSKDAELTQLGETLVQSIAQRRLPIEGLTASPSLSAGLCLFRPAPDSAASLEQQAITICNQARREGGNRLVVYQTAVPTIKPPEQPKAVEVLELVRQALRDNQIQTAFLVLANPQERQRELHDMQWRIATLSGEQLGAGEIITMAKQAIGLNRDLDRWLIGRALDTLREHRQAGRETGLLIHQTVETLADPQFASWLRDELRRRLLVGTGLVLEFNLADLVTDIKGTRVLLGELGIMGVEMCLGRFSRNEASQKVLRYLKTPYVKVSDKLLTSDAETIAALIQQAHDMGAKLIAPKASEPRVVAKTWLAAGADFVQANALKS